MSGCVKALDHLPANVLKQALLPMVKSVWDTICKILEYKYNDIEIVLYICNVIQRLIKALNVELTPLFGSMAKVLLHAFSMNAENIKCLRVFAFACSILGR
jgi:hypothetical protein